MDNIQQLSPFRRAMLDCLLASYVFYIHAMALVGMVALYFAVKDPVQLCSFAVKGVYQLWR